MATLSLLLLVGVRGSKSPLGLKPFPARINSMSFCAPRFVGAAWSVKHIPRDDSVGWSVRGLPPRCQLYSHQNATGLLLAGGCEVLLP